MKLISLVAGATLALLASRSSAQAPEPGNNAYQIQVRIDTDSMMVSGLAKVTFINRSDVIVNEIPFHLYPNAFRGLESAWARGVARSRGSWPAMGATPEALGYLRIEEIKRSDGSDLRDATRIEETRMWVTLDRPVPPGESVTLDIRFSTKLPEVVSRMGYRGPDLNLMQWFPKMGVFQNGSWTCHPFHGMGEFFADFGTYDVSLTLPVGYVCDATGSRLNDQTRREVTAEAGAREFETVSFHAENVHDFAFTASPNVKLHELECQGVRVAYLCQPYAEAKAETVLSTVSKCLALYDEWFMPYPYERLVIDGENWSQGGGMEYPMLFTIGQHFPNLPWLENCMDDPVGVTIHEFGHQYWYGLLASDEVTSPWLDEGLTSYVTLKVKDELFPPGEGSALFDPLETALILEPFLNRTFGVGLPFTLPLGEIELGPIDVSPLPCIGYPVSPFYEGDDTWLGFRFADIVGGGSEEQRWVDAKRGALKAAGTSPLIASIAEMPPGTERALAYDKALLALLTVERHIGWEVMREGLRTYAQRFAYRHPTTEDFFAVLQEKGGPATTRLIDELFRKPGLVDFAVTGLASERVGSNPGYLEQKRPGDGIGKRFGSELAASQEGPWQSEVVVRNLGDAILPVEIEFLFEDGTRLRRSWDGRASAVFGFGPGGETPSPPSRLIAALIDPDEKFPIDIDRNNNGMRLEPNTPAVTTLAAWTTFWIQSYLAGFSFFW
ncbi:MAG: M1 family metallopeptidase [Planctomycetota bacterium]